MEYKKTISFITDDLENESSFRLEKKPTKEFLELHIKHCEYILKDKKINLVVIWEDYNFIPYKEFEINKLKYIWQK